MSFSQVYVPVMSRFGTFDSICMYVNVCERERERERVKDLILARQFPYSCPNGQIRLFRVICLSLLFQGMYAVVVGPYSGARCENRATLWRVRVPAAEKIMSQHYAADSVPAFTESVLLEILYELREGRTLHLPMKPKVIILQSINTLQVTASLVLRQDYSSIFYIFFRIRYKNT